MYFSIMLDRSFNGPVIIASSRGGTSIEDLAVSSPELIIKEPVDIMNGLQPAQVDRVVAELGLAGKPAVQAKDCIRALWKMFISTDGSLNEAIRVVISMYYVWGDILRKRRACRVGASYLFGWKRDKQKKNFAHHSLQHR